MSKKIAVVGDIHGCLEELEEMMEQNILPILDTLEQVVFVGDYIDRGPDSKGVFAYVQKIPKVKMLKGNHEDMMATELVDGRQAYWGMNGGGATKMSYDMDFDKMFDDAMVMKSLPLMFRFGRVVVSHAGLNPYFSVEEQDSNTLIWGRDYVGHDREYEGGVFSVFGHTPVENILLRRNQMGIDTGCVFGNKLSAVVLDEDANWVKEFHVESKQKKY